MNTTALQKKRKSIDLSVSALQKLSVMAALQGQSLKVFIENVLETKAESSDVVYTNPSPSGDPWFDVPENLAAVKRDIEYAKQHPGRVYTLNEIRKLLGA